MARNRLYLLTDNVFSTRINLRPSLQNVFAQLTPECTLGWYKQGKKLMQVLCFLTFWYHSIWRAMVKYTSCPKSKLCRHYDYDLRLFSKVITHAPNFIVQYYHYRPQRSLGKVMFLHVSVILFSGGGWYPSMNCRWYPSMPCSRSQRRGGIPACFAGF